MNLKLMLPALVFTGSIQTAAAEVIPVEEKKGLVGGLLVGAMVGGPFGAGVGGIVGGGLIGKALANARIKEELGVALHESRERYSSEKEAWERSVDALNDDLNHLIALQKDSWKNQETPIQFRTGSSELEAHYQSQLQKIARVLARNHDATITLSGFADRRGEEQSNLDLSKQRVQAVRRYLVRRGVRSGQILTNAYGETKPLRQVESLEGNFFDRRVVMTLSLDVESQLATR